MDDDDDLIGGEFSGAPRDLTSQLAVLQREQADAQERARKVRQQQLQQATETIKARRYGPSRAEQLFALSAALAQPVRGGWGQVWSNVAPVLAQNAAARREGAQTREDKLLDLQQKYALGQIEDEQAGIRDRVSMLRATASALKPARQRTGFNPQTGRLYDLDTGAEIPLQTTGGADGIPTVSSPDEAMKLPRGTRFRTPDGRIKIATGGPTGSAPSVGFRP